MAIHRNSILQELFLCWAQFINRKTSRFNNLKKRLGLAKLAERYLVKKLTQQEIQSIRKSFCVDFISRKIQAQNLQNGQNAIIHFYIFLVQSIGDIIANEPIPRYLKSISPTGTVHWIVNISFKAVLEANPYVDEIIPVKSFAEGEDLCHAFAKIDNNIIVDCHFNGIALDTKRKPHENPVNPDVNVYTHYFFGPLLSTFSLAAGLPPLNDRPIFHLRSGIVRPDFGVSDYIVFHCRSNESARDWNNSRWCRLAESLANEGFTIVEIGTERVVTDNYNGRIIDYTGKKDLQELATIIRDARLFIGIDSAFGHMANCFMTTSIILLGKYKHFDTYLPYSGPFPDSDNFTIIRAPAGHTASHVDFTEVLTAANKKLLSSPVTHNLPKSVS